jgi:hypothetical protein
MEGQQSCVQFVYKGVSNYRNNPPSFGLAILPALLRHFSIRKDSHIKGIGTIGALRLVEETK